RRRPPPVLGGSAAPHRAQAPPSPSATGASSSSVRGIVPSVAWHDPAGTGIRRTGRLIPADQRGRVVRRRVAWAVLAGLERGAARFAAAAATAAGSAPQVGPPA